MFSSHFTTQSALINMTLVWRQVKMSTSALCWIIRQTASNGLLRLQSSPSTFYRSFLNFPPYSEPVTAVSTDRWFHVPQFWDWTGSCLNLPECLQSRCFLSNRKQVPTSEVLRLSSVFRCWVSVQAPFIGFQYTTVTENKSLFQWLHEIRILE